MVQTLDARTFLERSDDVIVRRQLRDLNEPMCFFGESTSERRQRLTQALANLGPEERQRIQSSKEFKGLIEYKGEEQIFYRNGTEDLKNARYRIAAYSIKQANDRLDATRFEQELEPLSERQIKQQNYMEKVRQVEDLGNYIDDDCSTTEYKRVTSCSFSPSAHLLATSYQSGKCKLWSVPDMNPMLTFRGHQPNIQANFIVFNPMSGSDKLSQEAANLATCTMDGSIFMWNLVDESPVCKLSGPQHWMVSRIRYHPSGSYLASCCTDKSWRLWDLEKETEILHQEGHSDEVFDIAFHPDGSLGATASKDSTSRVWDLRSGRSIQLLEGHTEGIRAIDFSPDGYHLATGGMDNSVLIWNLRQRKLEYTIPAHVHAVSSVVFEKQHGYYLATSSFDKTVKFWSNTTWAPVKTLDSYDDKVTKLDISNGGEYLATCHSKFIKLWTVNMSNDNGY